MAKTLHSQSRGHGFDPCWGTEMPHAGQRGQQRRKEEIPPQPILQGRRRRGAGHVKREGAARLSGASAPGWAWEGHTGNERGRGWQLLKGEINPGRRTGKGSHG